MEGKGKKSLNQYKGLNSNKEYRYNLEVGKTIISEKFPSTMDGFWFSVNQNIIINPFDFVSVENMYNTRTVGIVKELQAVKTDSLGLAEQLQKSQ